MWGNDFCDGSQLTNLKCIPNRHENRGDWTPYPKFVSALDYMKLIER